MKKAWLIPLVIATIAMSPQEAFASYNAYLKSGIKAYKSKKYKTAKRSFEAAIQQSKSGDVAHYYLANTLMKLGYKNKALSEYKKAYTLCRSRQMQRNCAQVLKRYNIALPTLTNESIGVRSARAHMTPYSVKSLDEITKDLGKSSGVKLKDSHPGGPRKYSAVPETSAGMNSAWDRWIQNFRLSFNKILYRQIGSANFALWGRSKVVFSVSKNRRLRSRIVSSNAPYFWDHYILETTKIMDNNQVLNFPRGSNIEGFNFSMGWNNGQSKKRISQQTMIELNRIQAKLKRNPMTGQRAIANRLPQTRRNVRSNLSSQAVSAKLNTQSASGKLTSQKTGALPLPSFKTSVSSLILPKPKPKELKATQHKINTAGKKVPTTREKPKEK